MCHPDPPWASLSRARYLEEFSPTRAGPPTTGLAVVLVPIDNRLRLDRACSRLLLQVLLSWSSHPALPFPNPDSLHPCLSPSRPPCHPPLPGGRHLPPAPPAHPSLRRVLLGATCSCPRVLASIILPLHLTHLPLAGGPPPLSRPCMSSGPLLASPPSPLPLAG